jgi:FkbM family methyltransferase
MNILRPIAYKVPLLRGILNRVSELESQFKILSQRVTRLETALAAVSPAIVPITTPASAPAASAARDIAMEKMILTELIARSRSGSVLTCRVNGVDMLAPVEFLRLYPLALHPSDEQQLSFNVEVMQCNWLVSKLRPGDTALDIGASHGAITLPMAQRVGPQGHVYAFEPARAARASLNQLVSLNGIQNVTVVGAAVSDFGGSAEFREYTSENELSWASDMSALLAGPPQDKYFTTYTVDVITIDEFVAQHGLSPVAAKLDIEGNEFYALQGARNTLQKFMPSLCLDIHHDFKAGKNALDDVQPFLSALGYKLRSNETGKILFAEK